MVRIFFGCALACAVLIMGSFVSTLRLSIQQGESLREVQRLHKVGDAPGHRTLPSEPLPTNGVSPARPWSARDE